MYTPQELPLDLLRTREITSKTFGTPEEYVTPKSHFLLPAVQDEDDDGVPY